AKNKLDQLIQDLPAAKNEEFSPMARRAEELMETLIKSWDISREVHMDYLRILREYQVNRVDTRILEKVDRQNCQPLGDAINGEFDRSDKSLHAFGKTLEESKKDMPAGELASRELQQLIDKLTRILDAMGDLTTINKLIKDLLEIEKGERAALES